MPFTLRVLVVFSILLGWAGVSGQAQPLLDPHSDVIRLSPLELKARQAAVRVLASPATGQGERVSYTSFMGDVYELTRFRGYHVDVLLPDAWTAPGALSAEQIQAFVDRTDLVYQHFFDLVGIPPAGEGRMPIAFILNACGGGDNLLGCAFLGAKGVEIKDSPELRPQFWQEIADDLTSNVLIHELTHNFDFFSGHVGYTEDDAHAWTAFLSYYYHAYTWEGRSGIPAEDVVKEWNEITGSYFRDPKATWARCVRDRRCGGILSYLTWGGFNLRLGLLEGPQATRRFLAFLNEHRQSHQPAATARAKNDLLIKAWSAGAQRDMSCVVDAWRWSLSDTLRGTLGSLYPGPSPDCRDRDRDGFNRLQGDCNDRRPGIRPGAVERLPGIDDDCDGRVDERIWREAAGRDFPGSPRLTLPAEISGTVGGLDADSFTFSLRSAGRLRIKGCSARYGEVYLVDETGARRPILYPESCTENVILLDAGTWQVEVTLPGESGARYSISLEISPPWPPAPWARTAPPDRQGGDFVLTVTSLLSRPPGPGAEIRFWVSGLGFVGKVPYTGDAAFVWTPPPGFDPVADGLTYRAQLLVRGAPARVITRPQPFAVP